MIKLTNILNEVVNDKDSFTEFAGKRLKGATKITDNAKEKGGPSMLTYHHFVVKLPYYEKAANGKFNIEKAEVEFKKLMKELCKVNKDVKITQTEFQRLLGKIEVLGELLIKNK